MKKGHLLFITILFLLMLLVPVYNLKADSGWDSSYDSGSDWSSDSDWSSSDWSSDSSWSSSDWSSSSGAVGKVGKYILIVEAIFWEILVTPFYIFALSGCLDQKMSHKKSVAILLVIRIVVLILGNMVTYLFCIFDMLLIFSLPLILGNKIKIHNSNSYNKKIDYDEVNDSILEHYNILDKEKLKEELYQNYLDVQNAWMNIEYDKLRPLLTDEMYNMYKSQLDVLKMKKQKNIMSDFRKLKAKITSISSKDNILTLTLYLKVEMYDYVVDNYGKVVRGNNNRKMTINYLITYQKNITKETNICPNCNAPITNKASNTCEYCKSTIVKTSDDWVMSKKQNIGQS